MISAETLAAASRVASHAALMSTPEFLIDALEAGDHDPIPAAADSPTVPRADAGAPNDRRSDDGRPRAR